MVSEHCHATGASSDSETLMIGDMQCDNCQNRLQYIIYDQKNLYNLYYKRNSFMHEGRHTELFNFQVQVSLLHFEGHNSGSFLRKMNFQEQF